MGLPGVTMAGLDSDVPLHGGVVRVRHPSQGLGPRPGDRHNGLSRFFQALGISVTAGRAFTSDEASHALPVAVISEALAARFWPGRDVLGRSIETTGSAVPLTIVGVVRDTSSASLWREKEMAVYRTVGSGSMRSLSVVVKTSGDVQQLSRALRARAHTLDRRVRIRSCPAIQSPPALDSAVASGRCRRRGARIDRTASRVGGDLRRARVDRGRDRTRQIGHLDGARGRPPRRHPDHCCETSLHRRNRARAWPRGRCCRWTRHRPIRVRRQPGGSPDLHIRAARFSPLSLSPRAICRLGVHRVSSRWRRFSTTVTVPPGSNDDGSRLSPRVSDAAEKPRR